MLAINVIFSYVPTLFGAIGRTKFQGKNTSNKAYLLHGVFIRGKIGNPFSFM
jgi:hypothetical protein